MLCADVKSQSNKALCYLCVYALYGMINIGGYMKVRKGRRYPIGAESHLVGTSNDQSMMEFKHHCNLVHNAVSSQTAAAAAGC